MPFKHMDRKTYMKAEIRSIGMPAKLGGLVVQGETHST